MTSFTDQILTTETPIDDLMKHHLKNYIAAVKEKHSKNPPNVPRIDLDTAHIISISDALYAIIRFVISSEDFTNEKFCAVGSSLYESCMGRVINFLIDNNDKKNLLFLRNSILYRCNEIVKSIDGLLN